MQSLFKLKKFLVASILLFSVAHAEGSLPFDVFAGDDPRFDGLREMGCTGCHKELGSAGQGEARTLEELNKVFKGMKYEDARRKLNLNVEEHKKAQLSNYQLELSLYTLISDLNKK